MLGLLFWTIDVFGFKAWALPFIVIGMNSITIHLGAKITDFEHRAAAIFGGMRPPGGAAAEESPLEKRTNPAAPSETGPAHGARDAVSGTRRSQKPLE